MARECPQPKVDRRRPANQSDDRGGYKRRRVENNTSLRVNADGGYDL